MAPRKVLKNEKVSATINKIYVGPQIITRSKSALFRANGIRNCFVAIRPNLELLCRLWLRHNEPNVRLGDSLLRRQSVAGGILFDVNGEVKEFGNDYLPFPPRPTCPPATPLVDHVDHVGQNSIHDTDEDFDQSLPPSSSSSSSLLAKSIPPIPVEATQPTQTIESVELDQSGASVCAEDVKEMDIEVSEKSNIAIAAIRPYLRIAPLNKSDFLERDSKKPNTTTTTTNTDCHVSSVTPVTTVAFSSPFPVSDYGNRENTETAQIEPVEPVIHAPQAPHYSWIAGPSAYVDPFRRTNGGFALYGRRRSVCVLTSIPEIPELPDAEQPNNNKKQND